MEETFTIIRKLERVQNIKKILFSFNKNLITMIQLLGF